MTAPMPFANTFCSDVHYGPDVVARLPELLEARGLEGRPVLIVSDPGLEPLGLTGRLVDTLGGRRVEVFTKLASNPTAAQVDAAAEVLRRCGAGTVVGLGGGSALDVAKMAAVVASDAGGAEDYALLRHPLPPRACSLVAVPTTAGTGSEVTRTVVFQGRDGAKLWAWGEGLRPDLAVLDPTLATGLPAHLSAATGADALVHAIEATTNKRCNPLSDAAALHAITLIRESLPTVMASPSDLDARGRMLLAATLAGQAIDGAGTAIAHALGHGLGTLAGVHHGRAVALSLRVALSGNAEAAPAAHARVARAFGLEGGNESVLAAALPGAYADFLEEVGITPSLADTGLGKDDAERLAALCALPENRPMVEANCRAFDEAGILDLCRRLLDHPCKSKGKL